MTNGKRKGISPIIATVLLIAITIAAGLAIYGWVSGLISSGTANTKLVGAGSVTMTLVSVSKSNGVTVTITDEGANSVTLTASNFYFVNSTGSFPANGIKGSTVSTSGTVKISPGTPAIITIAWPTSTSAGTLTGTYTLEIVGAQDSAGNAVIANSISVTYP